MKQLDRPGYSACDIRPDGGFVAVTEPRDSHLLTHRGTLVCPDVPHWPRCTPVGPFKVAVQGNKRTREWLGGIDWLIHRESCGAPGPVLYDRAGLLHISDCSGGSEGYHHVAPDGRLVWGSEVNVRAGSELRETTDLGDGITAGQGQWGGAWVQLPDGYRELLPGSAMCVRATRDGDQVAVCWYEPTPGSAIAHFRWFTIDELRALPVKATTRPPVTYAPVVPIGRPLWMGFFEFVPASGLPSNCRIPVWQDASSLPVEGPDWDYVAGSPDGDVAAIEHVVRIHTLPNNENEVLAYVPRGAQHALPTSADIQGVEAYLGATETDAEFLARIATSLRKCPRAALIAQCYTSNTTLTSDLRRLPGLISQLARDHANVEAILVFSGSGRATGWQDHPEVHAAWQLVFDGITGTPVVEQPAPEPVEPMEPTPEPEPPPAPEPPRPPTMEQPPYTPPVAHRPDKPIGGNAIADFFKALGRINFRKVFKGWFR